VEDVASIAHSVARGASGRDESDAAGVGALDTAPPGARGRHPKAAGSMIAEASSARSASRA